MPRPFARPSTRAEVDKAGIGAVVFSPAREVGDDPQATYATDVFAGARTTERDRVLAVEWSRTGRDLKELGDMGFLDRFGREMGSIALGFPDRPVSEVMTRIIDLHRRHGRAVLAALTAAVRHHAEEIAADRLAQGSLIAAFARGGTIENMASRPGTVPAPPPPEGADESAAAAEADIFPLQVRLFRFRKRPAVEILNLGTVTGAHVGVVGALRPRHEEDRRAGLARDQCQFVLSGTLAGSLGISKSAIGVQVKRCRDGLATQYLLVTGQDPPRCLLIESEARGYRVDPDARFLASGEGRDDSP